MNIYICAVQFKGGSLQVAISLVKEFVKFPENQYYVVTSKEVKKQLSGFKFPNNFHFYDLPYPSNSRLLNLILRKRFLAEVEKVAKADCTICTSGPLYWKPKSPLVIGYNLAHHLYLESPFFNRIPLWRKLRWKLRWAVHKSCYLKESSLIFVQTDDINERLKKALNMDDVYTISNTYNDAYINPQKFADKLPHKEQDEFRLLMISAFYKHKNFEIIPKVIKELKRRNENKFKFVLTLPENYFNMLFSESDTDMVCNVGFVPAKEGPSLYNECDAMFLPTLLECFSASYAEAMVMHKPIITSDLGFAHTVCKDAAIYFNPDDAQEIAEKIIELKNNKNMQDSLVEKGVKQMAQFGSAEKRARRILELCKMATEK